MVIMPSSSSDVYKLLAAVACKTAHTEPALKQSNWAESTFQLNVIFGGWARGGGGGNTEIANMTKLLMAGFVNKQQLGHTHTNLCHHGRG